MRVPEIHSQTGLTKKFVFCANFHKLLVKSDSPKGPPRGRGINAGGMMNIEIFENEQKMKFTVGATIGYVSGAALMLTGAILLFTDSEREKIISFVPVPNGIAGTF